MSKTDCNIIKDLLPSYVDDLCSEESCAIVEEHLQECPECRNLIKQMKEFQLVPGKKETHKEIDYLKKIKNNNLRKNVLTGLYMAAILVSGIVIWVQSIGHTTVPVIVYGCLAWAMVSIIYLLFGDLIRNQLSNKSKNIYRCFTGISGVLCIYTVILMLLLSKWNLFTDVLNMEMQEIGPFIQIQLCVIAVISLLKYLSTIVTSIKNSEYMIMPSILSSIGMNLSLMMMAFLGNLDIVDTLLQGILIRILFLLVICIILVFMLNIAKTNENIKKIISGAFIVITLAGSVASGFIWGNTITTDNQKILDEAVQFYYQETTSLSSSQSILSNNALNSPACLSLDPVSHEFTFSYDALSSYYSYGTYKITDDKLVAATNDGLYYYTFTIKDDETLVFIEDESSSVKLTDSNLGQQIKDGCKFTKQMIGITN